MSDGITNTGTALSMVGMFSTQLGGAFEAAGLDAAADAFNTFGSIVGTVGGVVSTLGSLMGLLTPIISASTAASTANTAAEGANAAAKGASVGATVAATVAQGGLNAAMYACPIVWIIAAVMILIALIVILAVALSSAAEETPEAKLEAAAKAAEEAGKAAEAAAEKYNTLKDSLAGLDDKYAGLDDLTRGTQEWNDAVNEINNSVLDLIDEYPELASLVENKDGVLHLDTESEEVKSVINKYSNQANQAKAAEIGAKLDVSDKEQAVARSNAAKKVNGSIYLTEQQEKLGEALASGQVYRDDNGNFKFIEGADPSKLGLDENALKNFSTMTDEAA
jgi:type II secretory pathway pseudopilin PulG